MTETEIWDKIWFMELSCKLKCVVRFLFDKCDSVGVWEPNYIIASAYIGETLTEKEILSIDNGKQFELLENGKIFIPGFCDFQYGELTENCKPHLSVIKKLKKLNLYERVYKGYTKGFQTLEEKDKEKDKDKDKEKEKEKEERGSGGKQKNGLSKLEIESEQVEVKLEYISLVEDLQGKTQNECWLTIKQFVEEKKPEFIEPYTDVWNIFGIRTGLIKQPITITDNRKSKIRIRVREPMFKFFEILNVINQSKFLKGENDRGWKVDFDFIIHSEQNYIQILEGKYTK